MDEVKRITSLLRKTFERHAWYGPSVMEVISDITPDLAICRLENTHSIIELINHMTSWRTYVIKKIHGDYDFKIDDSTNFPLHTDWKASVERLQATQHELLQVLEQFESSKLSENVPHDGRPYTFYALLHGIIHHDIYHTGQIALIKKTSTPKL
jgi:uncharacterized damage-inducible protein DinB